MEGELTVEFPEGSTDVRIGGRRISLAPRERSVLAVLAARPGCVVTKQQLLGTVWGGAAEGHAVEVTVARLRRRLGALVLIETVPRRGYRVVAHGSASSTAAPSGD